MKGTFTNGIIRVTLSRRNLRTLLLKLDEPDSIKTLWRQQGGTLPDLLVSAESDEEHYTEDRPAAGLMHPREESRL